MALRCLTPTGNSRMFFLPALYIFRDKLVANNPLISPAISGGGTFDGGGQGTRLLVAAHLFLQVLHTTSENDSNKVTGFNSKLVKSMWATKNTLLLSIKHLGILIMIG